MHHFYPVGDVEDIVKASKPIMAKSDVVRQTADLGKDAEEFRTSSQAWLDNSNSAAAANFDHRVSLLTRIPQSNNEPLQVLRYFGGEFYAAHMDYTELQYYPGQIDEWRRVHYGYQNRMITVFSYLSDAPGGHTIFPRAHGAPMPTDFHDCKNGFKAPAKAGNVVMWYNTFPNGVGDTHSLHGGCPPIGGYVKWSANKWVSMKPLYLPRAPRIPDHPVLARLGLLDEKIKTKPKSSEL
eukprot:GEMP01055274.1.p1 GENE.GEMP01055274.1~~GEMP01055274.1.p1  ORF type:complete len:238 (+),score=51.82 GEMP01055274.1:492-1205(+)